MCCLLCYVSYIMCLTGWMYSIQQINFSTVFFVLNEKVKYYTTISLQMDNISILWRIFLLKRNAAETISYVLRNSKLSVSYYACMKVE